MVVKRSDFLAFLQRAADRQVKEIGEVFVPARSPRTEESSTFFTRLNAGVQPLLDSYRAIDPVKILFYLTRERLGNGKPVGGRRLIAGVKACDLKALSLLDDALIHGDFVDPAYAEWRRRSIIVAADCTEIGPTCHCNLTDGTPWSEAGFDLNLSFADELILIHSGSEAGEELLRLLSQQLDSADEEASLRARIDEQRRRVLQKLEEQNRPFEREGLYLHYRRPKKDLWKQEAASCIGCGACTHICPTCYCLILNDESKNGRFIKERSYDSCQWNGYARVAGGGTPRPHMTDRFRNRYLCKFDYMQHNFGRIGCTGCGRCTEACAGRIDFRRVVKTVENAVKAA